MTQLKCLLKEKKKIEIRWLYKVKKKAKGKIERYKVKQSSKIKKNLVWSKTSIKNMEQQNRQIFSR